MLVVADKGESGVGPQVEPLPTAGVALLPGVPRFGALLQFHRGVHRSRGSCSAIVGLAVRAERLTPVPQPTPFGVTDHLPHVPAGVPLVGVPLALLPCINMIPWKTTGPFRGGVGPGLRLSDAVAEVIPR